MKTKPVEVKVLFKYPNGATDIYMRGCEYIASNWFKKFGVPKNYIEVGDKLTFRPSIIKGRKNK